MSYEEDYEAARARIRRALTQSPRVITPRRDAWMSRTGPAWWIGYTIHEPREFLYAAPRRLACRLLGWHNPTCVGRPAPHPRRW